MKTLQDLFFDELADMYDAENRIAKALPKMAAAAKGEDLKTAFADHAKETQGHVAKLEKVFGYFGKKARRKTCEATVGLLKEADEIAAEFKGSPALDAALIAAAQKVEHYEIASYGCLREWALVLENEKSSDLLQEILEEELAANQALTENAEAEANEEGVGASEGLTAPQARRNGTKAKAADRVPTDVGGQPENDEDARAAGMKSATDARPLRKRS